MSEASEWVRRSAHPGVATADFPLIAVGILEKQGVVARRVLVAILRAFDILRAGLADDRAEAVDFFFRVRPKGKAVGIAAVARFLVETDEGRRFALSLGVIADLSFRDADLRETQRREKYVIKFPSFGKVGHPKINMIEAVDTHARKMMFATNTCQRRPQPSNNRTGTHAAKKTAQPTPVPA